ncbi:MAG: hypothetical protein ACKOWQ_07565 [Aquirufa sp.]
MQLNPLETQIINELICDLCSNLIDEDQQALISQNCLNAYKNPFDYIQENEENLGWITISLETANQFIASSVPALAICHCLTTHLSDFFIKGFDLDLIHLQIKQKIQHKRFPEIDKYYKTIKANDKKKVSIHSFEKYKAWLSKQITKIDPNLTAVYFDDHFNDNLYLCLVQLEKTQRILANCRLLGIHIKCI